MRGSTGLNQAASAAAGAFRFSFASKEDEQAYFNRPAANMPTSKSAQKPNYAMQRDSVDILQNLNQAGGSRIRAAYEVKPDQNEYALKDYRNRTSSPAQLLSEM